MQKILISSNTLLKNDSNTEQVLERAFFCCILFLRSWILRHVGRDVFLNYLLFRFLESNIPFRTFFPRFRLILKNWKNISKILIIFAKILDLLIVQNANYSRQKNSIFFLWLKNHQNCLSDKNPSSFVSFCFRTSVELHYSKSSKQYRKIICSLFGLLLVTKNEHAKKIMLVSEKNTSFIF